MPHTRATVRSPALLATFGAALVGVACVVGGCSDGPHGWPGDGVTDGGETGGEGGTGGGSDAGSGAVDASHDAAPLVVEGCAEADFAASDETAAGAARLVQVPTTPTPAPFTPRCMRVRVGQTVTFRGDLASHPLEFDVTLLGGPGTAKYTLGGPDGAANENTVTVLNQGYVTYKCANHPTVMRGAVQVVP
jgi:plastocyanin